MDQQQQIARIGRYRNPVDDESCDEFGHSKECYIIMDNTPELCALEQAKAAQDRLERLDRLTDLSESVLQPRNANSLETLYGMGQETFVYTLR
jgi:hypothetical protein